MLEIDIDRYFGYRQAANNMPSCLEEWDFVSEKRQNFHINLKTKLI
jgi:hypothetical protein